GGSHTVVLPVLPLSSIATVRKDFYREYITTTAQRDWWHNEDNAAAVNSIVDYLFQSGSLFFETEETPEEVEFVLEMIDADLDETIINFFPYFKYPFDTNYANSYPEFTYLIQTEIPLLKNNGSLCNLIANLTGISVSQVKENLTWGKGPEINIVQ